MSKKGIGIVLGILIIIFVIIILIPKNKKNENEVSNVISENLSYDFDEESNKYTFYDENGDIKGETYDESVLDILKVDPDYDLEISNPQAEYNNDEELLTENNVEE